MEEKRLMLAVVLSLAVLILWQMVFKPVPPPKKPPVEMIEPGPPTDVAQPPQTAQPVPIQPTQPTPEDSPPSMGSGELVAGQLIVEAGAEPVDITINTDLYSCVISTAGGYIKSFELKKYREEAVKNSPLKQLVSKGLSENYKPLSIGLYLGGRSLPPSSVYSTELENIDLTGQAPGSTRVLELSLQTMDGYIIDRRYTFSSDSYQVDLGISVTSDDSSTEEAKIKGRVSEQAFLNWYTHVDPEKATSRFATFAALAYADVDYKEENPFADASFEKEDPKSLRKKGPFKYENAAWMGFADSYFLMAIFTEKGTVKVENDIEGPEGNQTVTQRLEFQSYYLDPGQTITHNAVAYLGPKEFDGLREIGFGLDRAVEYGMLELIIRPLIYLLKFFNGLVFNWGLAIILLTVFVKFVFYPLTYKSQLAMKKMQALQPRIKELQAKYKGEREKMNQEMMALYRTHKVNPLGGCLPMLLQLPVLYGLYRALYVSIELRHAHFLGWITDLSSPETLFTLPFFGGVDVGIMPLLMGGSMYIQQKMTPTTMDPAQAKMFMMMPVIFTFISFGFPAGLVLYWSVSNLLTIAQQYVINRRG